MISPEFKKTLEAEIVAAFPSVSIKVPPALTQSVSFPTNVRYLNLFVLDEIADPRKTTESVFIGIDYPIMDQEWMRVASDYLGKRRAFSLVYEELQNNVFDTVTTTPLRIPVSVDSGGLAKFSLFLDVPTGSTSLIVIKVLKDNVDVVFSKTIFPSAVKLKDWNDVYCDVPLTMIGSSASFTIEVSTRAIGASPLGVKVGRSVLQPGPPIRYAVRAYGSTMRDMWGKISRGVMRFQVFAKNKEKGREPSPSVFVAMQDIVLQVVEKIRFYIWSHWNKHGLSDIGDTVPSYGVIGDADSFMSAIFDVRLVIPDVGIESTIELPIKTIVTEEIELK